MLDITPLK